MIKKYFGFDIIVSFLALSGVFAYVMYQTGSLSQSLASLIICLTLSAVEIAVSFDNASMNATILEDMDEVWRRRFLVYGIIIAVFVVRGFVPIEIVAIAGDMSFFEALKLAFVDPEKNAVLLKSAHIAIAGFGASFLLLLALEFFFNNEKEVHWIKVLEKPLSMFSKKTGDELLAVTITLLALLIVCIFTPRHEVVTLLLSGCIGIAVHLSIKMLNNVLKDSQAKMVGTAIRSGIGSFIYLEVIDASFSIDGVVGALAITNNIIFIMVGLGIGSLFVRSLTIMLVDLKTLKTYRFMEHGAFYAILSLAIVMFITIFKEVSEFVTAGMSILFILSAVIFSKYSKELP